jgi:hypothetical protein
LFGILVLFTSLAVSSFFFLFWRNRSFGVSRLRTDYGTVDRFRHLESLLWCVISPCQDAYRQKTVEYRADRAVFEQAVFACPEGLHRLQLCSRPGPCVRHCVSHQFLPAPRTAALCFCFLITSTFRSVSIPMLRNIAAVVLHSNDTVTFPFYSKWKSTGDRILPQKDRFPI